MHIGVDSQNFDLVLIQEYHIQCRAISTRKVRLTDSHDFPNQGQGKRIKVLEQIKQEVWVCK